MRASMVLIGHKNVGKAVQVTVIGCVRLRKFLRGGDAVSMTTSSSVFTTGPVKKSFTQENNHTDEYVETLV